MLTKIWMKLILCVFFFVLSRSHEKSIHILKWGKRQLSRKKSYWRLAKITNRWREKAKYKKLSIFLKDKTLSGHYFYNKRNLSLLLYLSTPPWNAWPLRNSRFLSPPPLSPLILRPQISSVFANVEACVLRLYFCHTVQISSTVRFK